MVMCVKDYLGLFSVQEASFKSPGQETSFFSKKSLLGYRVLVK